MKCKHCGSADAACREIKCACGKALGCLKEPPGVSWSEQQWKQKLGGMYCPPCLPPPDPREVRRRQLAALGLTEAQAASALVTAQGDKAPGWARDVHAETLRHLAGIS